MTDKLAHFPKQVLIYAALSIIYYLNQYCQAFYPIAFVSAESPNNECENNEGLSHRGFSAQSHEIVAYLQRECYIRPCEGNLVTSIEAIINRQLLRWELERKLADEGEQEGHTPSIIVTISRQTGSRGSYFGSRLAQKMSYQRLNRTVIDTICNSPGYRQGLVESLETSIKNELDEFTERILSKNSDDSDYFRHLCSTMLSMSHLGGVIVMGRGANFILGDKRGFRIRVVSPREKRIENLMKYSSLTEENAIKQIDSSDQQRQDFVVSMFDCHIDQPLHYDMILNSSLIDVEEMVDTAVVAIKAKMNKLTFFDHDLA